LASNKPFLSLDGQCDKLEKDKLATIIDRVKTKDILLETNYYNLVSCSKVKFAKAINTNGEHVYNASNFNDWISYYQNDCKVSEYLMRNLLRLERSLNSRTAYYLGEIIDSNTLTTVQFNDLKGVIQGEVNPNARRYIGDKTWIWVSGKTFGSLKRLIEWLWDNGFRHIVRKIINGYRFLQNYPMRTFDELVNLRNSIFHFRPLSVYLVYGKRNRDYARFTIRRTVVEDVFFQNPCSFIRPLMNEILNNASCFKDIKIII